MASQLFENLFTKGLDKDTELSKVSRDALIDAKNCVITGDKDFYALKQLKSTKELDEIIGGESGYDILGAFPAVIRYTFYPLSSEEFNNSIVIFVRDNTGYSAIYFYDIVRDTLFEYAAGLGFEEGSTVDAFVTSEQGIEEIYFVDGVNPLRRIILDFDGSTITNNKTLTVQRYAPYKSLDYHTAKEGRGSLISGTYQFAYRWVNEDTGIASTYSLLTNPIPVYPNEDNEALTGDLDPLYGGLPNEATTYALFLTIEESNLDSLYTSLQLAVIKNIDGSKGVQTVAYQSDPRRDWKTSITSGTAYEGRNVPYNAYGIEYTGLEIEREISVSEIVVDDAPIKTFKTIDLKDNRIIGGNVSYFDRVVKPSDITIGDAYTIKRQVGGQSGYDYSQVTTPYSLIEAPVTYVSTNTSPSIPTVNTMQVTLSDPSVLAYVTVGEYCYIDAGDPDFAGYYKVTAKGVDTVNFTIEEFLPNGSTPNSPTAFIGDKFYPNTLEKKDNYNGAGENGGGYKNIRNTVDRKGYFRDEVYRFGLTYMDEFGNWSNPVPIDFSDFKADGVIRTGEKYNKSTATGWNDWKFPRRDTNEFSLFAQETVPNGNVNVSALGLKLDNISNHPEWAKAVAVVRTRRIKDIVGQSPHIPVIAIQSTQANPTESTEEKCVLDINANSIGTISPKKINQGAARNIVRRIEDLGVNNVACAYEPYYRDSTSELHFILNGGYFFFPEYLYQLAGTSFDFRSYIGLDMEIIDACNFFMPPTFAWDAGKKPPNSRFISDQASLAFRADGFYNYYYNFVTNPLALNNTNVPSFSDFVEKTTFKTTSSLFTTANGSSVALEASFNGSDVVTKILTFFDTDNVGKDNYAEYGVSTTKGTLIQLDGYLGDATNLSWSGFGSSSYLGEVSNDNSIATDYRKNSIPWNSSYKIYGDSITSDTDGNINMIPNGNQSPVSASWIVNFKKGLQDDRYGDPNQSQEYIFTGAYAAINNPTDNISLEVFGGDCFITKPTFKVNDSVASSFYGSVPTTDTCYNSFLTGGDFKNRLGTYRDFQEVISCYVESEVNCDLQANKFRYPVVDDEKPLAFSGDYTYDYHFGYSAQNEQKVFTSIDLTNPTSSNEFKSRVINSDLRILQSTQVGDNGFDRFRNTSFYDMPEDYGGITKFEKLSNDNVYVFQERGVSILPINAKVIQTATGDQLSINTTDLYDTPRYLMTENGCQHMRSIAKSDTEIIFFDAESREVLKVGGSTGSKISDVGMYSYFKDNFDTNLVIPQNKISAVYDYNRSEYILMLQDIVDTDYVNNVGSTNNISKQVAVFSDRTQTWHSQYNFTNNLYRMVFAGKELYAFADDVTFNLKLYEMYGGDGYLNIFGTDEEAEFSMVVNPEATVAKTYDNIRISSSNRLKDLSIQAYEENGVTQDTVMSLDVVPRDNGYEVPALRNQSGGRMRGRYFVLTGTIDDTTNEVSISSVTSKYRLSNRIFR